MTFYKFSEIEKELMYNMSQELHQIECLDAAKDVVDFIDRDLLDNINDLKVICFIVEVLAALWTNALSINKDA